MENKGTIEELMSKAGKTGGTFFKLKINGHNYSVFDKTPAYDQLTKAEFKLGETVGFDYTETPGTYMGKQITYKNIVAFTKVTQPTPQETSAKPDNNAIWEAKDRRIVRMASINAAIEFFKLNQLALPDEAKMITEVSLFKMAGMLEEWVYRDKIPTQGKEDNEGE